MRTGTYYLNNTGTRWVSLTDGVRDSVTIQLSNGEAITRKVIYWMQCGNYAACCISYKGKRVRCFPDNVLPA